ncbi:endospore germination permease [Cohnella faecalis]|uniref:GerAB/ArcD/ProY family transporter n=1 Tax=Cohnella faecalis TaxID=2315694 RepID=UPI00361964D1
MERISWAQLLCLVVLFQIGSTPLDLLAKGAGHDAWISVLVGMACGLLLLLLVFLPLHRLQPDGTLVDMLLRHFGKAIGGLVAAAYVVFFAYRALRNVRDFGELLNMNLYSETPLAVTMLVLTATAAFTVYKGIEVLGRMVEVLVPWTIVGYLFLFALIIGTGLLDFNRLLPLLEEGWKPVWSAVPGVISLPFSEMVLFLMFWNHAGRSYSAIVKWSTLGFVVNGLFITITNSVILAGLGPMAETAELPFLQLTNRIMIGGLFERMDPVISLLLFTGVFVKITAYYLGAVCALSRLFNKKERLFLLPVGLAIYAGSFLFHSYMEEVRVGAGINAMLHFPIFQIVIPVVLLAWIGIKLSLRRLGSRPSGPERQMGGSQ